MDLQESTFYDLDLGVTQNVAQYRQHHVTYAPENFEVAMSNGSGENAFTRKYIIWPWPQGQGHMKCCLVPSTSCDLCTGKIWSCYFQKFMRRCIYKKIHYLTFDLDLGVKVTQNITQYPLHHVIYASTKFEVSTSNGLGEVTITRNVTDGRWTYFGTKFTSMHLTCTVTCTRHRFTVTNH